MILVFGAGFAVIGALTMWGGISGTMPAMIAAIFAPSVLTPVKPSASLSTDVASAGAIASTAVKDAATATAHATHAVTKGARAFGGPITPFIP